MQERNVTGEVLLLSVKWSDCMKIEAHCIECCQTERLGGVEFHRFRCSPGRVHVAVPRPVFHVEQSCTAVRCSPGPLDEERVVLRSAGFSCLVVRQFVKKASRAGSFVHTLECSSQFERNTICTYSPYQPNFTGGLRSSWMLLFCCRTNLVCTVQCVIRLVLHSSGANLVMCVASNCVLHLL